MTNSQLKLLGTTDNAELTVPTNGSIVGICVNSTVARGDGTLTVKPRIDGVAINALTAVLDGIAEQWECTSIAKDTSGATFGGDMSKIDVIVTTDGSWNSTTADIVVNVVAEF